MKKPISLILTFSLLSYLTGCYSMNQVTEDEFKTDSKGKEIRVLTNDIELYQFADDFKIESDTLIGSGVRIVGEKETPYTGKIPLNKISSFEIKRVDGSKTAMLILSIAYTVAGMALIKAIGNGYSGSGN